MTEEERQTVIGIGGKLIDGFRNNPALLALIVLNVIMFGGIFMSVREERQMESEHRKAAEQQNDDMLKLLLACQQQH